MSRKTLLIFFLILNAIFSMRLCAEVVTLKSDLQDSQPKTIKYSDGTFGGLSIELMKLIERNSEYKFVLSKDFSATKRIEGNIESKVTDVHFGFGKTDDREIRFKFSGESLYDLQFILISKIDDGLSIKQVDDIKKLGKDGTIITIFGTNTVEYLKKDLGLIVDDGAKDIHACLNKLELKRGRFFVYNNLAVLYEINLPEYKNKFKVHSVEFEKFPHFIMYSKSTPQNVIAGIDEVIKKLKKTGEWKKVTDKYLKISR